MPYSNSIARGDTNEVPADLSREIVQQATEQSVTMERFRRANVSKRQNRFPVLSALPTAYWVNGDTGLKQTTEVNWANKYINVEELATIVPIPEAVLDDASFDVWGSIRPLLESAIGRALDAAVFFGVNKPASWPTDIVAAATAVSNNQARGASAASIGGVAQDLNLLFGKIETDGFSVNGVVARTSFKQVVRGARDTTGQALADLAAGTLWGEPMKFVQAGLWPTPGTGAAELIAGDFNQAVLGVRQDFTYKILDQAAIFDDEGNLIFNLAQQDMVAMRVVFRVGWQVANTINYEQLTEASRYPFGILTQP